MKLNKYEVLKGVLIGPTIYPIGATIELPSGEDEPKFVARFLATGTIKLSGAAEKVVAVKPDPVVEVVSEPAPEPEVKSEPEPAPEPAPEPEPEVVVTEKKSTKKK